MLKFFLHVSKEEQKQRPLARSNDSKKNRKFEAADLDERPRWGDYMSAFETTLGETTTQAPWYALPADKMGLPVTGCRDPSPRDRQAR